MEKVKMTVRCKFKSYIDPKLLSKGKEVPLSHVTLFIEILILVLCKWVHIPLPRGQRIFESEFNIWFHQILNLNMAIQKILSTSSYNLSIILVRLKIPSQGYLHPCAPVVSSDKLELDIVVLRNKTKTIICVKPSRRSVPYLQWS